MTHIIRVIDFETTGLEPPVAQVCEVGICDLHIEGMTVQEPKSWLCGVDTMPPDVRAVHHIKLSDCAGLDPFSDATLYDDATVIAAHNADFETKFFAPRLPVICTYKAALRVWPDAPGHSNGVLRYWLEDQGLIAPIDELTQPSHRAGPDAYVTAHILSALMKLATGKDMVAWTKQPKLMPKCPIGKFRGMAWSEVDAGFLAWMMKQADMEHDLKWNAAREIKRRESPHD
jgi:exodeoxyribonuclease X